MKGETPKKKNYEKAIIYLLIFGLVLSVSNQLQMVSMKPGNVGAVSGMTSVEAKVIPTGTPKIYGDELGISYDGVNPNNPRLADQTIETMSVLDRTIELDGEELERYVNIASQISCEYCCGVESIIYRKEDVETRNALILQAIESGEITESEADKYRMQPGTAACGCAHSFAMRGLAKYLITEHGDEFSDQEILDELAKWKTLYFPGQMSAKAQALEDNGIEFSYSNLGSNKYKGIEKGSSSSSSMVGGC